MSQHTSEAEWTVERVLVHRHSIVLVWNGTQMQSKSSMLSIGASCVAMGYIIYFAKKSWGQPLIAQWRIPLDMGLVICVCFHQRRYLLTARWRACTCWMGYLFSSSLHLFFVHPSTFPPSLDCSFSWQFLFLQAWSPTLYLCGTFSCCIICFCLSVLFPVAGGSRPGPSSVSGRAAPQPAACPTRGLSLPGRATHTSAPLLPLLRHIA